MNVLLTVLLTILVLGNLAMLIAVMGFKKKQSVKESKASRIGFAIMSGLFACNIIAILGGMIVCLA